MSKQKIFSLQTSDGKVIADQVAVAEGIWSRFKGLMLVAELQAGHGLCLRPCNSIHMFFMRIALDVVFVDKDGVVLHLLHGIKPWRISRIVSRSAAAIELPIGTLAAAGIEKGASLVMV